LHPEGKKGKGADLYHFPWGERATKESEENTVIPREKRKGEKKDQFFLLKKNTKSYIPWKRKKRRPRLVNRGKKEAAKKKGKRNLLYSPRLHKQEGGKRGKRQREEAPP